MGGGGISGGNSGGGGGGVVVVMMIMVRRNGKGLTLRLFEDHKTQNNMKSNANFLNAKGDRANSY